MGLFLLAYAILQTWAHTTNKPHQWWDFGTFRCAVSLIVAVAAATVLHSALESRYRRRVEEVLGRPPGAACLLLGEDVVAQCSEHGLGNSRLVLTDYHLVLFHYSARDDRPCGTSIVALKALSDLRYDDQSGRLVFKAKDGSAVRDFVLNLWWPNSGDSRTEVVHRGEAARFSRLLLQRISAAGLT
jgi:hypothetical protein